MAGEFVPVGATSSSSDVVRQSDVAAWFNSVADLLGGIDDQPRMSPANDGAQVLGFGSSYSVDVGVGNNGEIFLRGRTTTVGNDSSSAQKPAAEVSRVRISPGIIILAIAALLILKR